MLALPPAHGRACWAISADACLIPSGAPSAFLGASGLQSSVSSSEAGTGHTLQVASVSSRQRLRSTRFRSGVLPGIRAQTSSRSSATAPAATGHSCVTEALSSCLTSLRTSSEEAPLDSSVSPRGSFRPPGSPRGDALPPLASLSCGIVFADGPYPPPASERPLLSPRLVRSTGRSSAGAGHVLALHDACCPHSPI